jgi:hypothetical protein
LTEEIIERFPDEVIIEQLIYLIQSGRYNYAAKEGTLVSKRYYIMKLSAFC